MTFELLADRTLIDAESASTRHVLVRIQAPAAEGESERLPVNLAFVLDRSGSMQGEKIRLAREATLNAIRTLRERDRFSVVTYDDEVEVIVPATAATTEARHEAERRLREVTARRTTDLCGGWLAGCEQVARGLDEGGVGRCLLLTDGLANVGVTDHDELVGHARELAARSVETTTFGVGRDFDERLLDDMADAGAGNFYFIEGAAQIPDFIASEVGEALESWRATCSSSSQRRRACASAPSTTSPVRKRARAPSSRSAPSSPSRPLSSCSGLTSQAGRWAAPSS